MKKKVFCVAMMAAIVSVSAWNISQSTSETTLSDVGLANVEALAQTGIHQEGPCSMCLVNFEKICWRTSIDGCFGSRIWSV
jgi:hypothetical protein